MITGFNTDIQYQGVTYHVQTEDKGLNTPLILSLVYDGGTILASKRSSYNDLLAGDFDEKVLAERLQKQHKLMCAAIRAGRIEDLKRMTMKESANKQKGLIAQKQVTVAKKENQVETKKQAVEIARDNRKIARDNRKNDDSLLLELPGVAPRKPLDLPETLTEKKFETRKPIVPEQIKIAPQTELIDEELIIEAVEIIEEEIILPADAVEIISETAKNEHISDGQLRIEFLDEDTFKGGERKTLNILIRRGNEGAGLDEINVMVKVLGSSFRPLIFHSKTNSKGLAVIHVQFPHFKGGRAAILVRAVVDGEELETRRIIHQG